MMLVDLNLESHTAEALCDRAKILGTTSSVEEICEKKPENCVLVGKIIRIGELKRKDGIILRDFFEFSMKELCPDGKYGQDFLVVLFGKIAIEVADAKFMLSDKLIFFEPQVFVNPQYENQQGHKLHVQVGLRPGEGVAIWYARKYSEELAVTHASQRKLMVSNNKSNNNNVHSSRLGKDNSITATEKNEIHHKNKQYNKNNRIFSNSKNWMGKSVKSSSNIIHRRLLYTRNSENPFLSDSDLQHNSHTQGDTRETTMSPVNKNNNARKDTPATCVMEQNQVVSNYFSSSSLANHTVVSSNSVTKPAASECDNRKDDDGIDEENYSDLSTIFEEVSDVMTQKYLLCAGQTKSSTKESPKKEVNRNIVGEVNLDGDDCEKTGGTQQCRDTTSFNNRQTSLKSEHAGPKKTKINNNERPVNATKIFNKQSRSAYEKTKQTLIVKSGNCDHSPEKASEFTSKVNNNNGSKGTQPLNVEKNVDFEYRVNTNVCDGKVFNKKIHVGNSEAESKTSHCAVIGGDGYVRRKREECLRNLELLESLLNEDDEKESENTTTVERIVLTSSCEAYHEADGDGGASRNDNASVTAHKPNKLIPAMKSCNSDKQDCGDSSKRSCKKRVRFQFSDEENENICEENYCSDDNSMSLLAGGWGCVQVDDVLNNRQLSSVKSSSSRDCVAIQVAETGTKSSVEEPFKLLRNKSTSHSEIQKTSADANSDSTVACSEHSVDIDRNSHDCIQSENTEEKLLYLNDCVLELVGENSCLIKNILSINDSQNGGGSMNSSSVTDNTLVKGIHNAKTTGVPRSTQDSVVGCVGTKRKNDDKSNSQYNNSDLVKVQRLASDVTPKSQLSTNLGSSCSLEVNCSTLSLRKDVCVNTDDNNSESDEDSDISHDTDGSWSVISASLIDVYPPLTDDSLDLVSGYCDHNCFHKFTELVWVKNSNGMFVKPLCPAAFSEGMQRVPHLMFMFTLVVTDNEGKCHNFRVYKEHAEFFLGCKVDEYIKDKVKRARIISGLKSYIIASTESLTSETVNKKKLRLCIYNKGSVQIVVRRIRSSPLKLS